MLEFKPENLKKLNSYKMPFGKFQGVALIDLPEPYVVWFHENGEAKGEFGELMNELYEIKVNGLEPLVKKIN